MLIIESSAVILLVVSLVSDNGKLESVRVKLAHVEIHEYDVLIIPGTAIQIVDVCVAKEISDVRILYGNNNTIVLVVQYIYIGFVDTLIEVFEHSLSVPLKQRFVVLCHEGNVDTAVLQHIVDSSVAAKLLNERL